MADVKRCDVCGAIGEPRADDHWGALKGPEGWSLVRIIAEQAVDRDVCAACLPKVQKALGISE